MDERIVYRSLLVGMAALAVAVAVALVFISAPYGRHAKEGWGPKIDARLGWVLMESPAALGFAAALLWSGRALGAATACFFLLWETHYVHRAFVFPFRLRGGGRTPLVVVAMAFFFCSVNGYLNGRWLGFFSPGYPASWLLDPRFLVGTALFAGGFAINFHSDWILLHLRKPGERGYRIPRGGLYRLVSCPNYLGELIEWTGWAIATWSLPGALFALFTAANLLPRARSHHAWYRAEFPDYPGERRAVIPYLF